MIKFVISDYNWLPSDLSKGWFNEFTSDYLIYDKFHRLNESKNVIWQKNVGQNVYDIFDFIVKNYENLPEKTLFCRACLTFPSRDDKTAKTRGNCSLQEIRNLIDKHGLVELNDYSYLEKYKILSKKFKFIKEEDKFTIKSNSSLNFFENIFFRYGKYSFGRFNLPVSFCTKEDGFLEINSDWYFKYHKTRFFNSYDKFMSSFFSNYSSKKYIKFSPGCNYIIPSENIYRYKKELYIKLRALVDYGQVIGEAFMLERALFSIFEGKLEARY